MRDLRSWLARHGLVVLATAGVLHLVGAQGGDMAWGFVSMLIGLALADRVATVGNAVLGDAIQIVNDKRALGPAVRVAGIALYIVADLIRIASPVGALAPRLFGLGS